MNYILLYLRKTSDLLSTSGTCQLDFKTSWQVLMCTVRTTEFLYDFPLIETICYDNQLLNSRRSHLSRELYKQGVSRRIKAFRSLREDETCASMAMIQWWESLAKLVGKQGNVNMMVYHVRIPPPHGPLEFVWGIHAPISNKPNCQDFYAFVVQERAQARIQYKVETRIGHIFHWQFATPSVFFFVNLCSIASLEKSTCRGPKMSRSIIIR